MDRNQIEEVPVLPKNVVASRPEDCSLKNLGPSLQALKSIALAEVADHFYETILREEVRHSLDTRAHRFVKFHMQATKDNGFPEEMQGILQVSQVLQRLRS